MESTTLSRRGRSADEVLAWTRTLVDPGLRAAVDTLPGMMRLIAGYHFGWWDEHGRPQQADPGKAMRSALVLLSSAAVGGTPDDAVPAAVAVELVHNFSLLHDDVMDGDALRRHRPAAWSVFGVADAILAGDALQALATRTLVASGMPDVIGALGRLTGTLMEMCEGQSADTAFEGRSDVSVAECLAMVRGKTGALLGCACALGAMAGGAEYEQATRFADFGRHLGTSFQLTDDVLGIWGAPAVTGKPVYSDLLRRKKSLPVVAALTSETPAGREFARDYGRPDNGTSPDLAHWADLIERSGARSWARTRADSALADARSSLAAVRPVDDPAAAELLLLAEWATRRER